MKIRRTQIVKRAKEKAIDGWLQLSDKVVSMKVTKRQKVTDELLASWKRGRNEETIK